jgi:DNA-binding transcriptional MerR regulator
MPERSFRIGEVAERVGITSRTIRYYEELGLLGPSSERSKGAHRLYTGADVIRLTELVRLRDLLGLSLEELTALADTGQARAALRDRWADTTTNTQRAAIVDEALPLVERQLELVRVQQQKLDEFAAELTAKLSSLRREQRKFNQQKPRAHADT